MFLVLASLFVTIDDDDDEGEDPIVVFFPTTAPPLLAFRLLLRTLGTGIALSLSKTFFLRVQATKRNREMRCSCTAQYIFVLYHV